MKIKESIVGQIELYMMFYEEDKPDDKLYAATKCDFHKSLTDITLLRILESYGTVVCRMGQFDPEKIVCEYISKEDYEKNTSNNDEFNTFHCAFSDED